jgi:hypothetical protein
VIELELLNFFAANMSAVLGAILDKLASNLNDIRFSHLDPQIETILQKNNVLNVTNYGHKMMPMY